MTHADWATKDFYQVLGVAKDAPAAEVKKAYRKLARANHPDSHPGDTAAEERFKAVAEAYDVIGDTAKRAEYDQTRSMFSGGGFGGPGGGYGGYGEGGVPFDVNDLFGGGAGGGFSDVLGDVFGRAGAQGGARAGQRRTRSAARRGADLETSTTIGFGDSVDGATVSLRLASDAPCEACRGTGAKTGTVPRMCPDCQGAGMRAASAGGAFTINETCPTCRGRGMVVDDPCPVCRGAGRGLSDRSVQARIPAGVKDGQRIKLRGKGARGENGGPAGDLYVVVHVQPHRIFDRSGDNITLTVPISFDEAVLGAEVKVPTLTGPVTVKVPPGTPTGRTFRVRGRGVTRRDGLKGDLLVTVEVQVPPAPSDEVRAAAEAYREATAGTDLRGRLLDG